MLYLYHGTTSVCAIKARLERVRARPSYDRAITDYFTDADKERFRFPREEISHKVREILQGN